MPQIKNKLINSFIYAVVFIGVPLIMLTYFMLIWAHTYYIFLGKEWIGHFAIMSVGILLGIVFFYTRLRWVVVLALIFMLIQVALTFIDNFVTAHDIDLYFKLQNLSLKVFLFFVATLITYLLINNKVSNIIVSIMMIMIWIYLLIQSGFIHTYLKDYSIYGVILIMSIIMMYFLFVQRIHHQLYIEEMPSTWRAYILSVGMVILLVVIGMGHIWYFKNDIEAVQDNLTKKYENDWGESLQQRGQDGVKLNENTPLSGHNSRSNELLLVAYIDNYFEGTTVPNPLYLTSFYYTYFDSTTETFKRVDDMPDKDLFSPDPTSIPLYFKFVDSSVLTYTLGNRMMHTVDIEVYNKGVESSLFFAPTNAYSVQPIAVDKNFQYEYKNAYKAKSYVSELNSAYFVYNTDIPEIVEFQQRRAQILRAVTDYKDMDQEIYQYYTFLPQVPYLQNIHALAQEIAAQSEYPIDKVIAVKDYFHSKDENGQPLFRYSDNPGIPDLPSASKLSYFLFENRAGYCAYYAGATLLMLRSLGIPSRIAVGFLTQDRSTSNPGWYFFYANQLHAWVQVYFPGFGWIDFDTTIGNTEAQESPQPDGTPPTSPQQAVFVSEGVIEGVDTIKHQLALKVQKVLLNNDEKNLSIPIELVIDITNATILNKNTPLTIDQINIKDTATVIVFNKSLIAGKTLEKIIADVMPVERVLIRPYMDVSKQNESRAVHQKDILSYQLLIIIISVVILLILLLSLPTWINNYLKSKSQKSSKRLAYQYQWDWLRYNLYQHDVINVLKQLPILYLPEIDSTYNTHFTHFYQKYQAVKFNNADLASELLTLDNDIQTLLKQYYREKKKSFKLYNRINFVRAIRFLIYNR